MHTAKSFVARHSWVVRMARHLHVVVFGYGHDAFTEIRDPFPHGIPAHRSGLSEWRILLGLIVDECAITHSAASAHARGSHHAENRHVVLHGWNAGPRAIADHLANIVDLSVARRTAAQHDVGILRLRDVRRAER